MYIYKIDDAIPICTCISLIAEQSFHILRNYYHNSWYI